MILGQWRETLGTKNDDDETLIAIRIFTDNGFGSRATYRDGNPKQEQEKFNRAMHGLLGVPVFMTTLDRRVNWLLSFARQIRLYNSSFHLPPW